MAPLPFAEWEPVYEAILADLGFDRAADEAARDVAVDLLGGANGGGERDVVGERDAAGEREGREDTTGSDVDLAGLFAGATVCVVGAAPSLPAALAEFDPDSVDAVVAASTAADVLADNDVEVDCMVTDLDKNAGTARELTRRGVPVVAHAHGDNVPALRTWLPRFDRAATLVTTQAEPRGPVANYGGFTDGDRAAFLADAFGAAELRFLGWEFDDPTVDRLKARKLRWAEHLLYWLETRRGDRFGVLDGRRASLSNELTALSTR